MARLFAVYEAPLVPVTIKEGNLAVAVYLVPSELSDITGPVCPHQNAVALFSLSSFDPVSGVLVSTFKSKLRPPFCLLGLLVLRRQFSLSIVKLNLAYFLLLDFLFGFRLQLRLFLLSFSSD